MYKTIFLGFQRTTYEHMGMISGLESKKVDSWDQFDAVES